MRLPALLLSPLAAPLAAYALVSAPAPAPPAPAPSSWAAPVSAPMVVLEAFDAPNPDWLPGHRGVDLLALRGDAVRAAGAGVVEVAERIVDRGVVTVRHPDGRTTTYEPVDTEVRAGEQVALGRLLGRVGRGGHCSGTCLHWGLVAADGVTYLDPLALLRPPRAVLLPLP